VFRETTAAWLLFARTLAIVVFALVLGLLVVMGIITITSSGHGR
jgi:hypothetical protein